ncbi:MgtC/SapB family protein [Paracoccus yeei]|uniref:MgtC/SapB family protein n=1 Tax=Paracoccus yeei TaxID=147645 RepID=UPI003B8A678A
MPHLTVLAIAYLFALPIGWNREREERSAGLRTFPLVAVSCCGFVQAAEVRLRSADILGRKLIDTAATRAPQRRCRSASISVLFPVVPLISRAAA